MDSNMSRIVRPKPGEGEDELLKQQNEFFKKNIKPSVKIVNKRETEKRVSKFASKSKKKKSDNYSPINSSVLGDIKEKVPDYDKWQMTNPCTHKGFPEVFSSESTHDAENISVFSKHLLQQKEEPMIEYPDSTDSNQTSLVGNKSFILSGPDSSEIHRENVEKISKMSQEEILLEQENLKRTLGPNILEFIYSRRKLNTKPSNKLEMDVQKPGSSGVNTNISVKNDETVIRNDVLSMLQPPSENQKWLHMDIVEEDKLMWIGEIPEVKPINPEQPYNARFDFQGLLMPYVSETIDVREGLYNHGNEPERPGYSLEELFQLSRSSVQQQRIIALNVMSNILEKTKKGYYDECFNNGLVTLLLDYDIFLLLRFSLDDNTEAVLVPTLSAIKFLLCSEVDELCLDRTLGCSGSLYQPFLNVEKNSKELKDADLKANEGELKDYQILKLDVVKGALRTDIVPRIRYILEVLKPCPSAVLSCLQILIRLARHSFDSINTIIQCPELINVIIKYFVPKDWTSVVGERPADMVSVYNVPLVQAIKLLRILSTSTDFMYELIYKYKIMDPIMSYISIDPKESSLPLQEVLRITLDSFYIWQKFLAHNLATQHFIDMHPIFMRLLHFHSACTSVMQFCDDGSPFSYEHGTALISLIETAVHSAHISETLERGSATLLMYHHVKDFCGILQFCLTKWLTQMSYATKVTFSAAKLVGASLNCLAAFYGCHLHNLDEFKWPVEINNFFESVIQLFLKSSGFQKIAADLKSSSCLLFKGDLGCNRDPVPLPSVGALMWKGSCLTPVLQEHSPIPLMHGLLSFLQTVYAASKSLDSKCLQLLVSNNSLSEYMANVITQDTSLMVSHWFTHLEVNMLAVFCKLMHTKGCYSSSIHCLAFKLVTHLQIKDICVLSDLMINVIFNPSFFTEISICNEIAALQISDISSNEFSKNEIIRIAFNELPLIWEFYKNHLQLNQFPSKPCLVELVNAPAENGEKILLPVDWCYLPITSLYKEGKASIQADNDAIQCITRSLEWLLLLAELRPDSIASLPPVERFCNLSKIFLVRSDLFLDPSVQKLLSCVLSCLMQHYKQIEFPSSFYDLYSQLLEQYAAVSYGNSLFGQFLLIPLQQRHRSDLRKQIWSEHAAVLRILSTPVSELMFPISEMLEPCETDCSLLQCYLHCLATGIIKENWCPVLYKVALHHIATFLHLYGDSAFAEQLRSKINKMGNKELQSLLLSTV